VTRLVTRFGLVRGILYIWNGAHIAHFIIDIATSLRTSDLLSQKFYWLVDTPLTELSYATRFSNILLALILETQVPCVLAYVEYWYLL